MGGTTAVPPMLLPDTRMIRCAQRKSIRKEPERDVISTLVNEAELCPVRVALISMEKFGRNPDTEAGMDVNRGTGSAKGNEISGKGRRRRENECLQLAAVFGKMKVTAHVPG